MEEDYYILVQGILYHNEQGIPLVDVVFLGRRLPNNPISAHGLTVRENFIKCYDAEAWVKITKRGGRVPMGTPLSELRGKIGTLQNKRIYLLDIDNRNCYYSYSDMDVFKMFQRGL